MMLRLPADIAFCELAYYALLLVEAFDYMVLKSEILLRCSRSPTSSTTGPMTPIPPFRPRWTPCKGQLRGCLNLKSRWWTASWESYQQIRARPLSFDVQAPPERCWSPSSVAGESDGKDIQHFCCPDLERRGTTMAVQPMENPMLTKPGPLGPQWADQPWMTSCVQAPPPSCTQWPCPNQWSWTKQWRRCGLLHARWCPWSPPLPSFLWSTNLTELSQE